MVKKREKGWGATPAAEETEAAPEAASNISTNPEDRQPPALDEGWDTATPPSPMAMPAAADPVAAEPVKPKKTKKQKAEVAADEVIKTVPKEQGGNSDQLVSFVERVERLDEERRTVADDMKEVFAEAKAAGYDIAIMRKVLSRRRMDVDARKEMDALIDLYETALG